MKNTKGIYIFLLLLSVQSLSAQVVRKYSNEFLSIGAGARAMGTGNAIVGHSDDASSAYWNPAGLMGLAGKTELNLMHNEYFLGTKYDYAAFATPIDNTAYAAVSVIRMGVDNIPDTTELIDANGNVNYDNVKSLSVADYAFVLSYARKKPTVDSSRSSLFYGLNTKIIHRLIGPYGSAWGFGMDAGVQYRFKKLRLGLMAKDITGTYNAWRFNTDKLKESFTATGNNIPTSSLEITPPKFILGLSYSIPIKAKYTLTPLLDVDMNTDGKRNALISLPVSFDPHMGLEADFKKVVFLRAGAKNIQKAIRIDGKQEYIAEPTFGVGLRIRKVTLDYALNTLTGFSDQNVYSNVFSLRINLTK